MTYLKEQTGAALAMVLLVMMVLTVFALAAVNTIDNGMKITREYENEQIRLHNADGGIEYAFGLIERVVANNLELSTTDTSNSNIISETTDSDSNGNIDLLDEIKGSIVGSTDGVSSGDYDINLILLNENLYIDVDFLEAKRTPGSSSEFASRYEGIGTGTSGGVGLYYRLDSNTSSSTTHETTLEAHYRCIEGGNRCL